MPRVIATPMMAALVSPYTKPILFIEITFTSGPVYLWSGSGSVTWSGHTWVGAGSILGISSSEDAATVDSRGIVVSLSGIDATMSGDVLGEFQLGLPVTIYLGMLNGGGSIIADPLVSWAGRTDQPELDFGRDSLVISVNCESQLVDLNGTIDRRYTNTDQQSQYPGDLSLMFVAGIQQITIYWGAQANSANNI